MKTFEIRDVIKGELIMSVNSENVESVVASIKKIVYSTTLGLVEDYANISYDDFIISINDCKIKEYSNEMLKIYNENENPIFVYSETNLSDTDYGTFLYIVENKNLVLNYRKNK